MTFWRCSLRAVFLSSWSILKNIFTTDSNQSKVASLLKSIPVMSNFLQIFQEFNQNNFSTRNTYDANTTGGGFLLPYYCNKNPVSQEFLGRNCLSPGRLYYPSMLLLPPFVIPLVLLCNVLKLPHFVIKSTIKSYSFFYKNNFIRTRASHLTKS